MNNIDILGYVAATLTTASFIPQVYKIARTRSVKDISLVMYSVLLTGSALWTFYGINSKAWPIILANSITFMLVAAVVVMKILFKK